MADNVKETLKTDKILKSASKFASKKVKNVPSECKICGTSACYSYFGVIACNSCKMFFRRNAEKGQVSRFVFCFLFYYSNI